MFPFREFLSRRIRVFALGDIGKWKGPCLQRGLGSCRCGDTFVFVRVLDLLLFSSQLILRKKHIGSEQLPMSGLSSLSTG